MITTLLPIIKKVIKSKWNTVISWCKKHFKSIAVIIILILTAFLFYTHKQLKQKNEQLDRITNNYEYYSE
jgi:C4-dicarboxylate transporter